MNWKGAQMSKLEQEERAGISPGVTLALSWGRMGLGVGGEDYTTANRVCGGRQNTLQLRGGLPLVSFVVRHGRACSLAKLCGRSEYRGKASNPAQRLYQSCASSGGFSPWACEGRRSGSTWHPGVYQAVAALEGFPEARAVVYLDQGSGLSVVVHSPHLRAASLSVFPESLPRRHRHSSVFCFE